MTSVGIKEFNFSFDEILRMIEDKLAQGSAKSLAEHIFNWLSEIISNNYSDTVLAKTETVCCYTPYKLRHGKTQKTMLTSFGKLMANSQMLLIISSLMITRLVN